MPGILQRGCLVQPICQGFLTMTQTLLSELLSRLSDSQRAVATERERDVVVTAGAGSGKTHTLVSRYLTLLDEGLMPGELLAITFTEKASREMKFRVRRTLNELILSAPDASEREKWQEKLSGMDSALIGTIHGLCARILHGSFAEAGLDPAFSILDENQASLIKKRTVEIWMGEMAEQPAFHRLFAAFKISELESVFIDLIERRQDVNAIPDDSIDLSSLIQREMTALFENPGLREMVHKLASMGKQELQEDAGEKLADQISDFLRLWQNAETAWNNGEPLAALRDLQSAFAGKMKLNIGKTASAAKRTLKAIRDALDAGWRGLLSAENVRFSEADWQDYAELLTVLRTAFHALIAAYRTNLDQRNALDFDDLEAQALKVLRVPAVRERWQRQFKAILVDEFQDTNQRQRSLIETLATRPGQFFAVGDARQSIYRFRGADVSVFRAVQRAVQSGGGLLKDLDQTYRAHSALMDVSGDFLRRAMGSEDQPGADYEIPFSPLIAMRKTASEQENLPHLEFLLGYAPDSRENARTAAAEMLAARLLEFKQTSKLKSWDEAALLFRASSGFSLYETALERASIPFVTVSGKGFYDRPEVRDVLNMLRAIADPSDDLAMAGFLLSPVIGISKAALVQLRWGDGGSNTGNHFWDALRQDRSDLAAADRRIAAHARGILQTLVPLAGRVPIETMLSSLIEQTGYRAWLAASPDSRQWRNLDKLILDAQKSGMILADDFLDYIESLNDAGAREGEAPPDAAGAVRLMTIHKSKGLEFPLVTLADAGYSRSSRPAPVTLSRTYGLNLRTDPESLGYSLSVREERLQEEAESKRLLYVAMTRAREKLLISGHFSEKGALPGWVGTLLAPREKAVRGLTGSPEAAEIWKTENGFPYSVTVRPYAETTVRTEPRQKPVMEKLRENPIPLWTPLPRFEFRSGNSNLDPANQNMDISPEESG